MARYPQMTREEIIGIKKALNNGMNGREVSRLFGRSPSAVSRISKMPIVIDENDDVETISDLVLSLNEGEYKRLSMTARFYGFTSTTEFIKSVVAEKYYESKDEIDAMYSKEIRQKQFDDEFAKLKEKYADLFS